MFSDLWFLIGDAFIMIIHPHIPKRKKRKLNAKQRELKASWEAILKKYETKTEIRQSSKVVANYTPTPVFRRVSSLDSAPSLDSGVGSTSRREPLRYTGDAMIGIGQLHKSNSVPVFRKEDAEDQAKMRRN